MGHDVVGHEGDVITGVDFLTLVEADGVGLDDFFDDGLGHGGFPLIETVKDYLMAES
jgi:hypothetical protein